MFTAPSSSRHSASAALQTEPKDIYSHMHMRTWMPVAHAYGHDNMHAHRTNIIVPYGDDDMLLLLLLPWCCVHGGACCGSWVRRVWRTQTHACLFAYSMRLRCSHAFYECYKKICVHACAQTAHVVSTKVFYWCMYARIKSSLFFVYVSLPLLQNSISEFSVL